LGNGISLRQGDIADWRELVREVGFLTLHRKVALPSAILHSGESIRRRWLKMPSVSYSGADSCRSESLTVGDEGFLDAVKASRKGAGSNGSKRLQQRKGAVMTAPFLCLLLQFQFSRGSA
jgi:hypothetical protein